MIHGQQPGSLGPRRQENTDEKRGIMDWIDSLYSRICMKWAAGAAKGQIPIAFSLSCIVTLPLTMFKVWASAPLSHSSALLVLLIVEFAADASEVVAGIVILDALSTRVLISFRGHGVRANLQLTVSGGSRVATVEVMAPTRPTSSDTFLSVDAGILSRCGYSHDLVCRRRVALDPAGWGLNAVDGKGRNVGQGTRRPCISGYGSPQLQVSDSTAWSTSY